ncbi:hypothetical protein BAUCODRAFT_127458 [Baudoinia panamericana UAMH 10762]|uniref:Uncharacterized protein n=1 Tax=Baudoinia panamericana (strain UAMH 10762) TaxID=717646 RepID=M2MI63_BAUPA|nr:uncharacterized protein BAUCODRAFT_127458 [Baudoinia panamericana UAMH 10762]EMC90958.1 hypothetical protein BAUCODRAFT_127458 [Baudoinia panamericana UAMH 10762]
MSYQHPTDCIAAFARPRRNIRPPTGYPSFYSAASTASIRIAIDMFNSLLGVAVTATNAIDRTVVAIIYAATNCIFYAAVYGEDKTLITIDYLSVPELPTEYMRLWHGIALIVAVVLFLASATALFYLIHILSELHRRPRIIVIDDLAATTTLAVTRLLAHATMWHK